MSRSTVLGFSLQLVFHGTSHADEQTQSPIWGNYPDLAYFKGVGNARELFGTLSGVEVNGPVLDKFRMDSFSSQKYNDT
jgi:hypothetical protein